jgi:hypothetical protein
MNYAARAHETLKQARDDDKLAKLAMPQLWILLVSALVYAILDISDAIHGLRGN